LLRRSVRESEIEGIGRLEFLKKWNNMRERLNSHHNKKIKNKNIMLST
jgi:hypothetical protein